MKFFENGEGLTEPRGFFCSGVHCDVKGKNDGKNDLGIVYSKKPCSVAGVFTTNDVQGGSRSLLPKSAVRPFGQISWNRRQQRKCKRLHRGSG